MMNSFRRLINTIFDLIPLGPHNRSIRHALRQWMLRVWRLFPSELSRVAHVCQLWNNRSSQHPLQSQSLQWWKGNWATQVSLDRGTMLSYINSSGTNNIVFLKIIVLLLSHVFLYVLFIRKMTKENWWASLSRSLFFFSFFLCNRSAWVS